MNHPDTTPHPHDWQKGGTSPRDGRTRWVTCGTCGRSWDDAFITGRTPAPAGRCPFEVDGECDTTPLGSAERDPRISIAMPRSEWLRMAEVLALMAEDSHEMSRKEARTQSDADHLEEQGDWLQAKADEINGAADGGRDAF